MTKSKIIRRTIGIVALMCWAIVFVPWFVLPDGDRLAWQLQNWMMIPASILTLLYHILLIPFIKNEQNSLAKMWGWYPFVFVGGYCVIFFSVAISSADYKIWENEKYVIYGNRVHDNKNGGSCISSIFDFYERKGMVDDLRGVMGLDRKYQFNTPDMSRIRKLDYTIYEHLDLIKEEMYYMPYNTDSIHHLISFYRLSGPYDMYDQSQNDSLFDLIRGK